MVKDELTTVDQHPKDVGIRIGGVVRLVFLALRQTLGIKLTDLCLGLGDKMCHLLQFCWRWRTVEGLQVNQVKRQFEPPRIDLPVKAQIEIYKHEFLTKLLFCSLDVVKLFQKVTVAYRGKPIEVG